MQTVFLRESRPKVWVCGEGEYGRMGTGNSSSNNELMPVLGLEDRIVKQIAGMWFPLHFNVSLHSHCLLMPPPSL